jgi:hypothetical protein
MKPHLIEVYNPIIEGGDCILETWRKPLESIIITEPVIVTIDLDPDPEKQHHVPKEWIQSGARPPTGDDVRHLFQDIIKSENTDLPKAVYKNAEFRWSPSGKGLHLRMEMRGKDGFLTGWDIIEIRRRFGDDPKRLYYDAQRGQHHRMNLGGFLNDWKHGKRAGAWIPVP